MSTARRRGWPERCEWRRWAARTGPLVAALWLAACASVPTDERLLVQQRDGSVVAVTQPCGDRRPIALAAPRAADGWLEVEHLRVLSWNLHKGEDDGWQTDLGRFAAEHDVVLLQEAVLNDEVRAVLARAGLRWQMAGAFSWLGIERGVLVAARVPAMDVCTLRAFEPLALLPKSALVARFALRGGATLAVANLHAVNFTLGLGRFREQLEGVAAELERQPGPAVFAGDFNTWSQARLDVLAEVAARLGMTAAVPHPDGRRVALGQVLDHVYVRGLRVRRAVSPVVKSSDHNPVLVDLDAR